MRWLDAITGKAPRTEEVPVKERMAAAYEAAAQGKEIYHPMLVTRTGPFATAASGGSCIQRSRSITPSLHFKPSWRAACCAPLCTTGLATRTSPL